MRYSLATILTSLLFAASCMSAEPLKAGIIGADTSHAVEFTKLLNAPDAAPDLAGVKVVAFYAGGSEDIPSSKNRIAEYSEKLKALNVEAVPTIEALLQKVDVVLLESVDGRPHLQQAKLVFAAKKPVFIDKPLAASLADAREICRLAKEANVPCFSSSALRFCPGVAGIKSDPKLGAVIGCDAFSPCALEEHHPDLFWYGIHGVEILFAIMGPGCETVSRTQTKDSEIAVGVWKDGRVGTFRGMRAGKHDYGATVFGSKAVLPSGGFTSYRPLLVEIVKFFKTGQPPVSLEQTLEIYAFMQAADDSKRNAGRPVKLESVAK